MAILDAVNNKAGAERATEKISDLSGRDQICRRCGGLMVQDFCTDLLNHTGEFDCSVARCVQCGEVVDPVIQRNRHLQQTARHRSLEMKASVSIHQCGIRSSGSTHQSWSSAYSSTKEVSHAESKDSSGGIGNHPVAGSLSPVAADPAGDNKDMVLIPKGEFTMGSNEHADEVQAPSGA